MTYSLSQEDWDGPTGHVQRHVVDDIGDIIDREGTEFYVCGISEMVVQTNEDLANAGVPDDSVYSEGWEEDEVVEEWVARWGGTSGARGGVFKPS